MSKLGAQVNSLFRKLKEGDSSAFNELYELTYNHLKQVAYTYAEDKNDLEDILQTAYLRVFGYIHSKKANGDGYNLMCKLVQNAARDLYRGTSKINYYESVSFYSPEESIVNKNAVHSEIAKLPQEDQIIVYLRFWEGRTIRNVAEIVGLLKSVARRRIEEIKKKLGKFLK